MTSYNTPVSTSIKIWPVIGLNAIRTKNGGVFKILSLSKSIDPLGSGIVIQSELRNYCISLGVHPRTLSRWIARAHYIGIIDDAFRRKSNLKIFVLAGLVRAARIFSCTQIGKPVGLPLPLLLGNDWRSWLWAAFLATQQGRPISRGKMNELTGVPEQTQRDYEHRIGVLVTENYAVTDTKIDHIIGYREFVRRYAFAFEDSKTNGKVIAYQLPNSYTPPTEVVTMPIGRSRKTQKALNAALCIEEQGRGIDAVRLYHTTPRNANATLRKISRVDNHDHPKSVYLLRYLGQSVSWKEESENAQ